MTDKTINIISVDDHQIHNEGIRAFVDSVDDIQLVGTARTDKEMYKLLDAYKVDVILLDIELPSNISKDGLEIARELRLEKPTYNDIKIICVSSNARSYVLRELFGDIGIEGYLDKNFTTKNEIIESIRYVMSDEYVEPCCSPNIAKRICRIIKEDGDPKNGIEALSRRELELVPFIAEGKTNAEIASLLLKNKLGKITTKTVDNHRSHIYNKLNCKNSAQVAKLYYEYKRLSTDNPNNLPNFQK